MLRIRQRDCRFVVNFLILRLATAGNRAMALRIVVVTADDFCAVTIAGGVFLLVLSHAADAFA